MVINLYLNLLGIAVHLKSLRSSSSELFSPKLILISDYGH